MGWRLPVRGCVCGLRLLDSWQGDGNFRPLRRPMEGRQP